MSAPRAWRGVIPNGRQYAGRTEDQVLEAVRAYLPHNYRAHVRLLLDGTWDAIVIEGTDSGGWTMHDYVVPRLASGCHYVTEVTEDDR